MAKHQHGQRTINDRPQGNGYWSKRDDAGPAKTAERKILFPTEPTTIGRKKIDRAIERVIARKK